MLHVFRFMKLVRKPSNAIKRNAKLRLMSNDTKKPSDTATQISGGGSKCESKKKPEPEAKCKKSSELTKPVSCEKSPMKKVEKAKNEDPTAIQGAGPKIKYPCQKKPPVAADHGGGIWQKISLFFAIPTIAILSLAILSTRSEGERPEFIHYPYMYRRTKPFYFGDGNHSFFHNKHWNAIPPAGYEDEVDEGTGETDDEKKTRLKEFQETRKRWDKFAQNREKERQKEEEIARKQQEAAEALAKKQEAAAEAMAKKQQKAAEAMAKKQQEAAEVMAKKEQEAEEEMARKQQQAEAAEA